MSRVFIVAAATALSFTPILAMAQGAPRVRASRTHQQASISLQAGALRVTQTMTRKAFELQLTDGKDRVRFTGDVNGNVSVQRGDVSRAFSLRTGSSADQAAVIALLTESTAVRSFDSVMRSGWAASAKSAVLFRAAHSMLGALRGSDRPVAALFRNGAPAANASIIPVRRDGPAACWDAYSRDVIRYTFDLEGCIDEADDSINPLHLAWCAYEYNIKTSLALIWLLDCSGVLI
jgi:hypothetical protein